MAVMVALSNILSTPPFVIPVAIGPFNSSIHLTQLPILISGIFAGPLAGLITGAIGGLYMSFSVGIPFISGGLAILGLASGFFANKIGVRPFFSGVLAWIVQAPYVLVTDYIWFLFSIKMSSSTALTTVMIILLNLTVEALIASGLAAIIIPYIMKRKQNNSS